MGASKTMMVAAVSIAAACGSSAKPPPATPSSTGGVALAAATDDCDRDGGYELSVHDAPAAGAGELTVIGIYEARGDHSFENHPEGTFTLTTRRSGTVALLSYEPVHWIVRAENGALIDRVIVSGYHTQSAPTVPAGAAVDVHTGDDDKGYADSWPEAGGEHADVIAWVVQQAGRPVTRFRGCYHMSNLTLE